VEFRNVSGLGDLTVWLDNKTRRVNVAHGDTVEATGDDAVGMLAQPENWERVDKPKTKKADTTTDSKAGE
jgi:hypothetical protein